MSHKRLLHTYHLALEIPNSREPDVVPSINVIENWVDHQHTQSISLDSLYDELMHSHAHDQQALHRFSYYLLLKAQAFAQEDMSYQFLTQLHSVGHDLRLKDECLRVSLSLCFHSSLPAATC